MKNIGLLSIVTTMILLNGCGEDSKKSATEAVETTKIAVVNATDATKEVATKAVEAAKEASDKAIETTKKAAEATKKAVKEASAKVEEAAGDVLADGTGDALVKEGAKLYAKCIGCHGADGKTKALGKSAELAGLTKETVAEMLHAYKAGTRNEVGMGMLMKGQVASLDDKGILALSAYIATLK